MHVRGDLICPIELGRALAAGVGRDLVTTDAMALVTRPDVDIVVEMIGGIEPARELLLAAMRTGKSVVTANKALLGADSAVMHAAAREHGADLFYEAAVAGAIPLLRPLRESLAGDAVRRVLGIVNGTTNYILDRMDSSGADFRDALAEAQALGYAEADPTADVGGYDAAAKAAILASLAFHTRVSTADVYRQGITALTAADIEGARGLGGVVKLRLRPNPNFRVVIRADENTEYQFLQPVLSECTWAGVSYDFATQRGEAPDVFFREGGRAISAAERTPLTLRAGSACGAGQRQHRQGE